jgi:Domain of unknown function (DUF1816)
MKEFSIGLLNTFGLAWWVKIDTDKPRCTYYFGPFISSQEAELSKGGYLEDLEQEGAQGIRVEILRCKPSSLTIYEEGEEIFPPNQVPVFGGST